MIFSWWFFKIWPKLMIFKVLAKMKIFQIWAKIDDFFKFLAKMMIFQNLVKIDGFSNFNFLCHLKFSNSSQCGMLWCGVVLFRQHFCGVVWNWYHTTLLDSLIPRYPGTRLPTSQSAGTRISLPGPGYIITRCNERTSHLP